MGKKLEKLPIAPICKCDEPMTLVREGLNVFWKCIQEDCVNISYVTREALLLAKLDIDTRKYTLSVDLRNILKDFVEAELNDRTALKRFKRWWYWGVSPYQLYKYIKGLIAMRKANLSKRGLEAAYGMIGTLNGKNWEKTQALRKRAQSEIKYTVLDSSNTVEPIHEF